MHNPQPYFRKFDGWWYVQVTTAEGKRRQIKLAKGFDQKEEAYRKFHELMAQRDPAQVADRSRLNVASIFDAFLDWSERHQSRTTYEWYRGFLQGFCDVHGLELITELRPFHVTRWLDGKTWNQSTRRAAITGIKRALNWAVDEGYIPSHPLRSLKRPACNRRTQIITPEEHARMMAATDPAFAQVLNALAQTGARPGEVSAVTAAHVDLERGLWILDEHKTAKKTGRQRIIVLADAMVAVTRELVAQHPTGPLFRDSKGNAWNRNSIRLRMQRLRKKLDLPAGMVAYSYRHTYATEALTRDVPIAALADLLGHSDTKMISTHYAHLQQKLTYVRANAQQAVGDSPN